MTQQEDNKSNPFKMPDGSLNARSAEDLALIAARKNLEQKLTRTKAVLFWEALWPKVAVLLGIIALFLILSLYGVWSILPTFLHFIGLLVLLLTGVWASVRITRTAIPNRRAALRRLERSSELPHRPASSFGDTLSELENQDKDQPSQAINGSNVLWAAHKKRILNLFSKLKIGWPKSSLGQLDPYAFRGLVLLLLGFGFMLHGPQSWQQIKNSFSFSSATKQSEDIRIDAWLTPPSFTGKNPIMLSDGSMSLQKSVAKAAQEVPELTIKADGSAGKVKGFEVIENSELIVRIIGKEAGRYSVRHVIDDKTAKLLPFDVDKDKPKDEGATLKKLSYKLKSSSKIEILEGTRVVLSWPIHIQADLKPAISLSKNPEKTARSALLLTYQIADDFGVRQAQAKLLGVIRKNNPAKKEALQGGSSEQTGKDAPLGKPLNFDLKLPVASLKRGEAKTYKDLTAHPWAGLAVKLQLEATDQGGKKGHSEVLAFKLPERKFTKSTARALIELRRYLVLNPQGYSLVARGLAMLSIEAEKLKIDKTAYLSMRNIYWHIYQLRQKPYGKETRAEVRGLVDQMWDTALRIEDGNLSKSERDLRRAQDKLADAISRNASPKEIEQLMKELRQALGKYMQARKAQQKNQVGKNQPQQNSQGQQKSLTPNDLNQMLKRIEEMAKSGSKDAAQQMLNQLRDMLEGLQSPQQQNANNAQSKKMMELMDKFSKLAKQQQKLQEKTFQKNRQNMQPQGENNRFSRFNRLNKQRPWNNPRAFDRRNQRNRSGQTQPNNPYYRRSPNKRQGQRGQQGKGDGNKQPGLRGRDGQGGENNVGRPSRKGGEGRFNQGKTDKLAREQRGLQRQLDELMNELGRMGGAVPRELSKARQQMGRAGQQLNKDQLGRASKQQGKALDSLRAGAKKMAQEMMKKMSRRYGQNGRDPLGRQRGNSGFDPGMDVKVPDEIDTQRAREILEELRRRLGEMERSPAELDYLESLIKRF